jgi:hypothetical protein
MFYKPIDKAMSMIATFRIPSGVRYFGGMAISALSVHGLIKNGMPPTHDF